MDAAVGVVECNPILGDIAIRCEAEPLHDSLYLLAMA
jgi:hypothetical protein